MEHATNALYVQNYFKKSYKNNISAKINKISNDIKRSFKKIINALDWIHLNSSKQFLLKKVNFKKFY